MKLDAVLSDKARQPSTAMGVLQLSSVPKQRLFTVGPAARYLGMSADTLRKYADLGCIPTYRNPFNGHRVFKLEDLIRLIDSLPLWNDPASDMTRAGRV
jgi:hypothetical protein